MNILIQNKNRSCKKLIRLFGFLQLLLGWKWCEGYGNYKDFFLKNHLTLTIFYAKIYTILKSVEHESD